MTEKLHIDDAQLRELLHLMSHDLRNPLAAIVTNLEFAKRLLTRLSVDPDLAESVEDSVTACDVLRRIVANFDVIVKGRELAVTLQETDIGGLIKDVARRCGDRAKQGNLELLIEGADDKLSTMLDRTLFGLAIENLISNSVQHAPRGSKIRVTLSAEGETATLTVADDGAAVPVALRELAVGPEGHTPSGRAEGSRYGRGLGLLAARAAAQACGAELVVGGETSSTLTLKVPLLPT